LPGELKGLAEEAFGPGRIPFGREQEFDGLAGRVHCAIQIFVFAFNLYIGLVRAVTFVRRLQMWAAAFIQLRCVGLHPAPDATRIHLHAAFRQKFSDVFVGEGIA
jgi:hypothetical protein